MFCATLLVTFLFLATCPVLSLGDSTQQQQQQQQYSALQFGQDTRSYIDFSPNMVPFREKFTLCSWVKRRSSSHTSTWFSYRPAGASNEILIGDSGYYNFILGSHHDHRSDFSGVSQGTWFHYCASWSLESRTWRIYLGGQLIGTHPTPSGRTLRVDGSRLVLGNYAGVVGTSRSDDDYIFGGELYKLNIFANELSASQILEMASGGLCSEVEKQYRTTRQLKWEDILQLDRHGQVEEVDTECRPTDQRKILTKDEIDELLSELNVTKSKLNDTLETLEKKETALQEAESYLENANSRNEEVSSQLNGTLNELHQSKSDLKEVKVQLENTSSQLNGTLKELHQSKSDLKDVKVQLENTSSQLENATTCECPESQENTSIRWDVLYTNRFFNKVLTRELFEELRTSWDILGEFVGSVTLSDSVIRHFKVFYEYQESGCMDV